MVKELLTGLTKGDKITVNKNTNSFNKGQELHIIYADYSCKKNLRHCIGNGKIGEWVEHKLICRL